MKINLNKKLNIAVIYLLVLAMCLSAGIFSRLPFKSRADEDSEEIKNVIFMVGDGMGTGIVEAARWFKNGSGDELMEMEKADYIGELITRSYSTMSVRTEPNTKDNEPLTDQDGYYGGSVGSDKNYTDSAAAGTALATGRKTHNSRVGQNTDNAGAIIYKNILEAANEGGLRTGLITTKHLEDATPAAFSTHVHDRYATEAILANQISNGINILIGGTEGKTLNGIPDQIIEHTDAQKELITNLGYKYSFVNKKNNDGTYSQDRSDFDNWKDETNVYMRINKFKGNDNGTSSCPVSLAEITKKSLEVLNNDKGFVVMIEGGAIDDYEHGGNLASSVNEAIGFDNAVYEAKKFADSHPGTLVITTADHETGAVTLPDNLTSKEQLAALGEDVFYALSTYIAAGKTGTKYSHTSKNVPLYAYGTGAGRLVTAKRALDNTRVSKFIATELSLDLGIDTGEKDAVLIKLEKSGNLNSLLTAQPGKKFKISSDKGIALNESDLNAINSRNIEYLDLRDTEFKDKVLPAYAFKNNVNLKTVFLPESLLTVDNEAFRNCTSLKTIVFPETVETIGNYAFNNTALTKVEMPYRLLNVGDYAFYTGTLEQLNFPGNLFTSEALKLKDVAFTGQIIGYFSFYPETELNVRYWYVGNYKNAEGWKKYSAQFKALENQFTVNVSIWKFGLLSTIISEGSISTKNLRFVSSNVTDAYLNTADLTHLKTHGVVKLDMKNIDISSNRIAATTFQNCTTLKELILPDSITQIRDYAFDGCTSLESVVIGYNTSLIMHKAFANCPNLTKVQFTYNPATISKNVTVYLDDNQNYPKTVNPNSPSLGRKNDNSSANFIFQSSPNAVIYGLAGTAIETYCASGDDKRTFISNVYRVKVSDGGTVVYDKYVIEGSDIRDELNALYKGYTAAFSVNESKLSNVNENLTFDVAATKDNYTVTVENGTANKALANYGDKVTLTADIAATGQNFIGWAVISGNIIIVNNEFSVNDKNIVIKGIFEYEIYNIKTTGAKHTGAGKYNELITLVPEIPVGKHFVEWQVISGGITIDENNQFSMPLNDVEITAVFADSIYNINVEGGNYTGNPKYGETINLSYNAAPQGKEFGRWLVISGGNIIITNNSFIMPGNDVSVKALYENIIYNISVDGGSFQGEAYYGAIITLSADTATVGKKFAGWEIISGDITISANQFTMPLGNVSVKALYSDKEYTISVDGGSYSGTPKYGETITLTPSEEKGKVFTGWEVVSGGVIISDNKFMLQDSDVIIRAVYTTKSGCENQKSAMVIALSAFLMFAVSILKRKI